MTALTPDKDGAMTQEKLTDLLPCPFCGWEPSNDTVALAAEPIENVGTGYAVRCTCGVGTGLYPSKPLAVRNWNRRHRAAAEPKEDMKVRAYEWLKRHFGTETGEEEPPEYEVGQLAREFTLISTEATRKERERAAGIAETTTGSLRIAAAIRTPEEEK